MVGHRLSDGRTEVVCLYLPKGQKVTEEHLRAVTRLLHPSLTQKGENVL